eukprot:TRINITY_DN7419_c0_g1_i3.p1 TRINITY_DN7419_c0_g1~~TRINITY_DN7419_c0_g1_i3.p1  ORF type:complete len:593 (-),score=154.37 TRINITY_DN7419_c0_g1_i3:1289-2995(-)
MSTAGHSGEPHSEGKGAPEEQEEETEREKEQKQEEEEEKAKENGVAGDTDKEGEHRSDDRANTSKRRRQGARKSLLCVGVRTLLLFTDGLVVASSLDTSPDSLLSFHAFIPSHRLRFFYGREDDPSVFSVVDTASGRDLVLQAQSESDAKTWSEMLYQVAQGSVRTYARTRTPSMAERARRSCDLSSLVSSSFFDADGHINLQAAGAALLGPLGVKVKDRQHQLRAVKSSFVASEAVDWLVIHLDVPRVRAVGLCQELLDLGYFKGVAKNEWFEDNGAYFVVRTKDHLNTSQSWAGDARPPGVVVERHLSRLLSILASYVPAYEKFGKSALVIAALSDEFREFELDVCELQRVRLERLQSDEDRMAFFINLFNLITLHASLVQHLSSRCKNLASLMRFWKRTSYRVDGMTLSLLRIEHEILRSSAPRPEHLSASKFKKIQEGARKLKHLGIAKYHLMLPFSLFYGIEPSPPVHVYDPQTVQQQLQVNARSFLGNYLEVNPESGTVTVPAILGWYYRDFGRTEVDMLKSLIPLLPSRMCDDLLAMFEGKRKIKIKHTPIGPLLSFPFAH